MARLRFRNEATILGPDATDEDYVNRILPYKVAVDLEYMAHWSLGLDFRILWHLGDHPFQVVGTSGTHVASERVELIIDYPYKSYLPIVLKQG